MTGVIVASKSGLEALKAQITVDCSADADVAARAGAAYDKGRDEDGLMQPMTLFFRVKNVNNAVVEEYITSHPEDFRPFDSTGQERTRIGRVSHSAQGHRHVPHWRARGLAHQHHPPSPTRWHQRRRSDAG